MVKASPLGPLAITGLFALVLGMAALSYAARQINGSELDLERERVSRAFASERLSLLHAVADATEPDPEPRQKTGSARSTASLDWLWRVDSDAAADVARPDGSDDREEEALHGAVIEIAQLVGLGAASAQTTFALGGRAYEAVALLKPGAEGRPASRPVDVGVRRIDDSLIARLGFAAEARALHWVAPGGAAAADETFLSAGEGKNIRLFWRPDRPGDRVMLEGGTIVVGLAALFSALVIVRAKRIAGEIYTDGAQALEDSRHDWLSGLPNRVLFSHTLETELGRLRQGKAKLALLHLDVDRFERINDAFGTEVGDSLIRAVTARLVQAVPRGNLVARFEGDAFMILQRDVQGRSDCELLAERIQTAMRDPFEINGARLTASMSIGVSLAPDDAREGTELVRLSNLALYRAKREGRNRTAFFMPTMQEEWRRRSSIEDELRHAIEHKGLVVQYQPIISCETGRIVCVEALVRWLHPTEGLIAPDQFIGLAEDRGLIRPLGEWVLAQACRDAQTLSSVRVAVNVSPIQFKHQDFVATVDRVLEQSGLDPCRLELELTEGVIMENEDEAATAMAELRDRGVRLALDDFGTGYSSLIYLRRFAFDKIKIDRAFIEALEPTGESAILVDSVVRLGRALGLTVTAEGIETEEQRDFLERLGCHEIQGYLIARPLSLPDLATFLRDGTLPADCTEDDEAPRRAVA